MNFEKLYNAVILRDILEYLAPGSILTLSFFWIFEVNLQAININIPLASKILSSNTALFFYLGVSYISGHFLTGLDSILFRVAEEGEALQILNGNNILKDKVIKSYALVFGVSQEVASSQLEIPEQVNHLREIARGIISQKNQELYLEFIARHSILSRFCKNMSLTIALLLVFLIFTFIQKREIIFHIFNATTLDKFAIATLIPAAVLVAGFFAFQKRSSKLRKTMIKHTFTLWCKFEGHNKLPNYSITNFNLNS